MPHAPFKFSARTRVGFSDTDAQGIVYYGRYLPYMDLARVEYHRMLGLLGMDTGEPGVEFVMRACTIEYHATAEFDAHRTRDGELVVTATQTLVLVDLDERKPRPIPNEFRNAIRGYEGVV